MASLQNSLAQIEGKSFDLSTSRCDGENFVKIVEKGPKKTRWMSISSAMARWMVEILGSVHARVSRSVMKKRFGRALGWVKIRSNNKGRFVELGFSHRGKYAAIYVPGRRSGDSWGVFREALAEAADRSREVDTPPLNGVAKPRSYRDVTIGHRSCSTCGRPWVAAMTPAATISGDTAAARGHTRPSTRATTTQTNRELDNSPTSSGLLSVNGCPNGLQFSFNGATVHLTLDVGQFLTSVLQSLQPVLASSIPGLGQVDEGQLQLKNDSLHHQQRVGDQEMRSPTQLENVNAVVSNQRTGPSQEAGGLGLGEPSSVGATPLIRPDLEGLKGEEDYDNSEVGDSEATSSFGDSSCDLRETLQDDGASHVSDSLTIDLHGSDLFNDEAVGTTAAESQEANATDDKVGSMGKTQDVMGQPAELGNGIPPSSDNIFTLGSEEADLRGRELFKDMGIHLVDSMGKEIELGTQVYTRRKAKVCRELANLKTTINYDRRGLRKGFLNKS